MLACAALTLPLLRNGPLPLPRRSAVEGQECGRGTRKRSALGAVQRIGGQVELALAGAERRQDRRQLGLVPAQGFQRALQRFLPEPRRRGSDANDDRPRGSAHGCRRGSSRPPSPLPAPGSASDGRAHRGRRRRPAPSDPRARSPPGAADRSRAGTRPHRSAARRPAPTRESLPADRRHASGAAPRAGQDLLSRSATTALSTTAPKRMSRTA